MKAAARAIASIQPLPGKPAGAAVIGAPISHHLACLPREHRRRLAVTSSSVRCPGAPRRSRSCRYEKSAGNQDGAGRVATHLIGGSARKACPDGGMAAMPDNQKICMVSSRGGGKLLRGATDPNVRAQRDVVLISISTCCFEPAPAGTLAGLVRILYFADALAGPGQVLFHGDGDELCPDEFPGELNRLRQRAPGAGGVVVAHDDTADHHHSISPLPEDRGSVFFCHPRVLGCPVRSGPGTVDVRGGGARRQLRRCRQRSLPVTGRRPDGRSRTAGRIVGGA
jgi:hypothetical protein